MKTKTEISITINKGINEAFSKLVYASGGKKSTVIERLISLYLENPQILNSKTTS